MSQSAQDPALPVRLVDKPWGKRNLPPPFDAPEGRQIGEIWFEPPPALPELLVKYIFTSEKLSVQVHPNDKQAIVRSGGSRGKEECWLVLASEPGGKLGIGFREPISRPEMRAAALDGSIEDLLVWHDVQPGDFFYIPANTVHAIGAGVTLVEVQQNSDITYRLFDYGRPRELHLRDGIAVSAGEVYDLSRWHQHLGENGNAALAEGSYFRMDRIAGVPTEEVIGRYGDRPLLIAPLRGECYVAGVAIAPGGCGLAMKLADAGFADGGLALVMQPVEPGLQN